MTTGYILVNYDLCSSPELNALAKFRVSPSINSLRHERYRNPHFGFFHVSALKYDYDSFVLFKEHYKKIFEEQRVANKGLTELKSVVASRVS